MLVSSKIGCTVVLASLAQMFLKPVVHVHTLLLSFRCKFEDCSASTAL